MTESQSSGFSTKDAIAFGFKPGMSVFVLMLIIQVVLVGLPSAGLSFLPPWLRVLPLTIWHAVLMGGMYSMYLRAVDGEQPSFGDVFSQAGNFWKFLLLGLVSAMATAIGLIFLIIPGLLAATFLMFGPWRLAEGDTIDQAIKNSFKLVKDNFASVLLFCFGIFGVALAFIIALMIVVVPITIGMSMAHIKMHEILAAVMPLLVSPLSVVCMFATAHAVRQLEHKGDV